MSVAEAGLRHSPYVEVIKNVKIKINKYENKHRINQDIYRYVRMCDSRVIYNRNVVCPVSVC